MSLDKKALGLTFGVLWGGGLLLATLWVMVVGGGGHLVMLKRFYLGFDLTPVGAVIGAVWAFVDGFIGGWLLAWLYNRLSGAGKTPG